MADRSSFGLAIGAQTARGTPLTTGLKFIPETTFNTGLTFNRVEDDSVQGSRLGKPGRAGTTPVAPRIAGNLRPNVFDDLLANLFQGAWATNVLTQGSTKTWLTVEDRQPDAAAFIRIQDVITNTCALRFAPNAFVTFDFAMLGAAYLVGATGTTTPTAAGTDDVFDTWTAAINYGGAAFKMSSLDINFDNRGDSRYVLGSRAPDRAVFNTDRITGSFQAAYDGPARLQDALIDAPNAMSVVLTLGAKSLTLAFPRLITSGWESNVSTDPERLQTINFVADAVTGTKVTATRVP